MLQNYPSLKFTKKQQYYRIGYLGICFMFIFTSYNSLQNMISKLYDDQGYTNLGQTALIFVYLAVSLSTWVTSYIIKYFGYKKTMFMASIGYSIFQGTGLFIVTGVQISHTFVWVIVCAGAFICGFSASALWVSQGAYTSKVADENSKRELFAVFWIFKMTSQILGSLLTTFVAGNLNNTIYFISLTALGFLSAFLFLLLPDVEIQTQKEQKLVFKQQVRKVFAIVKNPKYKYINIYFFFPGLTLAFYAGFLYKIVKMSLPKQDLQDKQTYNMRVNEYSGYIFITLGVGQVLTGFFMNRFAQRFNIYKLATVGTLLVQGAGFISLFCYYKKSYELCFLASFLWGCSQTFLQTNTGGLVAKIFKSRVQGFSVFKILNSFGVVIVFISNIALSQYDSSIFLMIVLTFQTLVSGVSLNLQQVQKNQDQVSINEQQPLLNHNIQQK